ncbi:Lrp/AsnC family transcriptional regulator [Pseudobacteriovorax antillogorgiicola]|uniref:Transcriptional regulator, AsnC family n=1 Tax=Pseudobacteriovorax antillogorgiicola TaxID=1513793 RepID=A0A1Y6CRM5_9BACT|nr:Lrp/AsnC family transcriptional regulator [Pseudobacteriovorax antillogorgiicola]TCS46352.1 AsnC family transcriptional regulator [Pseudobacteriovorax antillogorgiicola]SMF68173.1 transcriptional regulator, AsnC family [Pseudobacteriovorax antillogorgiicola]
MDRTDIQIIKALQNNARLSNKELAGIVGLAPSSCLARVRNLIDQGVLKNFLAEIDPDAVGVGIQAMIAITLNIHSGHIFYQLTAYFQSQPEVRAFYHLSGVNDVLIHVMVRDTHHLRDFVMDKITSRDEVARCDTSIIYDDYRSSEMPIYCSIE